MASKNTTVDFLWTVIPALILVTIAWPVTTNHKDIGTLYLVFSLTTFFVGFANIAYEIPSNQPGPQLWS